MQIQVNTDNHISGSVELTRQVEAILEGALGRYGDRVTRVEVYLADQNSSAKSGNADQSCVLEARLGGLQPISVSDQGASLEQALDGAADKLQKALDRALGRLEDAGRGRLASRDDGTI